MDIGYELMMSFFRRSSSDLLIQNYYYKNYEMDLFRYTKSGFIYEYEIKVSLADFKKDFKKKSSWTGTAKHDLIKAGERVNYFYFVVPDELKDKIEVPAYCGLMTFKDNKFTVIKKANCLNKDKFKIPFPDIAYNLYYRGIRMMSKLKQPKTP